MPIDLGGSDLCLGRRASWAVHGIGAWVVQGCMGSWGAWFGGVTSYGGCAATGGSLKWQPTIDGQSDREGWRWMYGCVVWWSWRGWWSDLAGTGISVYDLGVRASYILVSDPQTKLLQLPRLNKLNHAQTCETNFFIHFVSQVWVAISFHRSGVTL